MDNAVQMVEGGDLPSINTGEITRLVSETKSISLCVSVSCSPYWLLEDQADS